MSLSFTFVVPGRPVSKARPRFYRGRVFTPERTQKHEALIASHGLAAMPEDWPRDRDYHVEVEFRCRTRARIDLDNLVKSICDGLNPTRTAPGVWYDDCQVQQLTASKRVVADDADVGSTVTITVLETHQRYSEPEPRKPRVRKTTAKRRHQKKR